METSSGIPYRNIINSKLLVAEQQVIRLLYYEQSIVILANGWDSYHVIVEDGANQTAEHRLMNAEEIKQTFNVDLAQY